MAESQISPYVCEKNENNVTASTAFVVYLHTRMVWDTAGRDEQRVLGSAQARIM